MNKRLTVKMGPGRATPARGALHRPPTVLGLRTPLNTLIADTRIDGIMPGGCGGALLSAKPKYVGHDSPPMPIAWESR